MNPPDQIHGGMAQLIFFFDNAALISEASIDTVDGSEIRLTTWDGAKTRRKEWECQLPTSTGFLAGFLPSTDMGVSKNNGTPKSSILIGFSIINHPFWDTPIFGNTHMHHIYLQFGGCTRQGGRLLGCCEKVLSFVGDPRGLKILVKWGCLGT